MAGTVIFDCSSNSHDDGTREHRATRKKNRPFSKAGERSDSEQAIAKECIIPSLERWSVDWTTFSSIRTLYEPRVRATSRDIPLCLRAGRQPTHTRAGTQQDKSGRKSDRSSRSWLDLSPESPEPSTPHCKTEQYIERLPPVKMGRFYRTMALDYQLTGPEDYLSWAEEIQAKLSQSNAWPIIEEDLAPLPSGSRYYTRWRQLNNKAWLLLISSVSWEIRRDLCTSCPWDTRGSWSYLRGRYGGFAATMTRSVQGVHDMTALRYEDCASLSEYLGKMKSCIRAIECNRSEKEIDGQLWCRFILAKLGPQWESWSSRYMMNMQGCESTGLSFGAVDQLLLDIEAEGARRAGAPRYSEMIIWQFRQFEVPGL